MNPLPRLVAFAKPCCKPLSGGVVNGSRESLALVLNENNRGLNCRLISSKLKELRVDLDAKRSREVAVDSGPEQSF